MSAEARPCPQIEFAGRDASATANARAGACKSIDLTVRQGEFVSIIGPSGCGKSTS